MAASAKISYDIDIESALNKFSALNSISNNMNPYGVNVPRAKSEIRLKSKNKFKIKKPNIMERRHSLNILALHQVSTSIADDDNIATVSPKNKFIKNIKPMNDNNTVVSPIMVMDSDYDIKSENKSSVSNDNSDNEFVFSPNIPITPIWSQSVKT